MRLISDPIQPSAKWQKVPDRKIWTMAISLPAEARLINFIFYIGVRVKLVHKIIRLTVDSPCFYQWLDQKQNKFVCWLNPAHPNHTLTSVWMQKQFWRSIVLRRVNAQICLLIFIELSILSRNHTAIDVFVVVFYNIYTSNPIKQSSIQFLQNYRS